MMLSEQQFDLCALCAEPVTELGGEYHGLPLCATCAAMARDYGERVENRIERLEQRAASKHGEATTRINQAHKMASVIPLGQPMMPDHYSYNRDRNYRNRIENNFRKGFEAHDEAKNLERRADAARSNRAISSDDPLAILKLIEKIAQHEKGQALMKAANKIVRNKKLTDEQKIAELVAVGFTPEKAHDLLHPRRSWEEVGFPGFELTNNNANIRRMKERLTELQRINAQRIEAAQSDDSADDTTEILPGVEAVRNRLENRLQIVFPGKPSEAARSILKAHGFRWSPTNAAWQRQLNNGAEWALECVVRDLRALPEYAAVQATTPSVDEPITVDEYNTEWLYWLSEGV